MCFSGMDLENVNILLHFGGKIEKDGTIKYIDEKKFCLKMA